MKTNYFLFFKHKINRNIIKKIVFSCLIFIVCCDNVFSQEEKQRNNYDISFGLHRRTYFGNTHVKFSPKDSLYDDPNINLSRYKKIGGFDYQSTLAFNFAVSYNYYINPSFFTSVGIKVFSNKELITSHPDTVLYYNSLYEYHRLITAYQNNYYNFGLQTLIGYSKKEFHIKAGFDIDIFLISRLTETQIDGNQIKASLTKEIFPKYDVFSAKVLVGRNIYQFKNDSKISLSFGTTIFFNKFYFKDLKISTKSFNYINLMLTYSF